MADKADSKQSLKDLQLTRRQFMIRAAMAGLATTAGSALLAACAPGQSSQPPVPAAGSAASAKSLSGTTISALFIADKTFVPTLTKDFEAQTGIKVNVELADYDSMLTKLAASASAKKGTYDVISSDIVSWRAAGYLEPLEARINALPNIDDLMGKDIAKTGDHLYGMPWLINDRIFVYNTKILKDAGFDKPPVTPDELVRQAQAIQQKGLSKYPIMFPWAQHEGEFNDFHAWLCTFGGHLFDDAYTKPRFNEPEGVAALQFLTDLNLKYKLVNPDSLASKSVQVTNVMAQGQTAFGTTWAILTGPFDDPASSKAVGQIRVGLYPAPSGKTPITEDGSESLGIASDSKNKDAAWEYLKFLTGKDTEKRLLLEQGNPPSWKSLYNDPAILKGNPNLPDQMKAREKTDIVPPVVWYDDFSPIMRVAILKAVTGQQPAQKAMDDAAADVAKLIKK